MASPKLRSPDQPLPLRMVLALYEFCASLKLAVILIFAAAFVLGMATFVESEYGLEAVHFGVYGTWWFFLINALLALNIFCAAAIRFPWKRYQTGFVITHLGLLVLLLGCWISRARGIDAQMPIFEGHVNSVATEDSQHFQLTVTSLNASDDARGHGEPQPLPPIPFRSGPFSWNEYGDTVGWFPWKLSPIDKGVIYDQDGIRLEVLDYYANSIEVDIPRVKLNITNPRMSRMGPSGREELGPETMSTVTLSVRRGIGNSRPATRSMMGGGSIGFWMSGSEAETQAFLNSAPEGELGENGQLVLWVDGKKHVLPVELEKRQPLGDSGYEVEIVDRFTPTTASTRGMTKIDVRLYKGDETIDLDLHSDRPELDQHAPEHGIFGAYWYSDPNLTSEDLMRGAGGSRIDIIQGHDQKLYYRNWNRKEVLAAAELPLDGALVDAFKMPIAQLKMRVEEFTPSPSHGKKILPVDFNKDFAARDCFRAAHLRMTVDGVEEEFWLVGKPFDPLNQPRTASQLRFVRAPNRVVSITLELDSIPLGYNVRLNEFERKLDPGTSQAAHFGSRINFEDPDTGKIVQEDVRIFMNVPIDFKDPLSGRKYRLFQEAFRGPYTPDDAIFRMVYPNATDPSPRFVTILTVNYDPGRGVKRAGCLLIVLGIATMFYMRAYFFTRPPARKKPKPAQPATKKDAPTAVPV